MITRKMLPQEIDATVILFNYYFEEACASIPGMAEEYDENSIIETIRYYNIDYRYTWINLYEGQRPVGFIAGFINECPWNIELVHANIAFVYIIPSHRNMDNFKSLLNNFTSWAKTMKAVKLSAGDIGIDVERSKTLYEHVGFKPILLMVKELAE